MKKKQDYTPKEQPKEKIVIQYVAMDAEPEPEISLKPQMPKSYDYDTKTWVDSCEIWDKYNTVQRPTGASPINGMAMDSRMAFDNQFAGSFGGNYGNGVASYLGQSYKLIVNAPYMGQATLMQFTQNNLLSVICQKKADRLTGKWIEFVGNDTDESKKNKDTLIKRIKELEDEFKRLRVQHWFNKAVAAAYKFGGCLLYPKLKGDEGTYQGLKEREEELLINKIGIGDIQYLQVILPWTITGINWVSDDPLSEWFYKPERWLVMGKVLHESRAMHFVYNELPDYLKPTYQFMGLPLIQQLVYDMNHYLTAKNEQIKIVQKLKFMILEKVDLKAIANNQPQNGTAPLTSRVQIAQQQMKNGDLITLGAEEKMSMLDYDVGHMPEVVRQNAELLCATAGMSALELFGFTPAGFSSVSDSEKESNNDKVRDDQQNIADHNLHRLLKMVMMNLWGEIDKNITFKWVNLESANPKEEAEIRNINAVVDMQYLQGGVISEESIVNRLNADENSGYEGLEVEDIDLTVEDPDESVENEAS